jgi:hypothetical protein
MRKDGMVARRMGLRRALTAAVVAGAAATAALALPAAAGAGGFATVGLSSLPDGTAPGQPWRLTMTILQHGRGPMSGLKPSVRIRSADGDTTRTFAARPAGKPGQYRVDVVFPSAGRWRYSIDDGFTLRHTFAPVAIGSSRAVPIPGSQSGAGPSGARAPEADTGGNVGAALAAAVAAGLLAALLTALLLRRRGRSEGTPAAAGSG